MGGLKPSYKSEDGRPLHSAAMESLPVTICLFCGFNPFGSQIFWRLLVNALPVLILRENEESFCK